VSIYIEHAYKNSDFYLNIWPIAATFSVTPNFGQSRKSAVTLTNFETEGTIHF
jgi:hypothetical protein